MEAQNKNIAITWGTESKPFCYWEFWQYLF